MRSATRTHRRLSAEGVSVWEQGVGKLPLPSAADMHKPHRVLGVRQGKGQEGLEGFAQLGSLGSQ